MQRQHHIHAEMWPRCAKVEIQNGTLHCDLALNRQYNLVDAYHLAPHIQFLNCKSIDEFLTFTRAWGPLYLVHTPGAEEIRVGKLTRRLDESQADQRWLRAIKYMIDACRGREDQRDSLVEFMAAEVDRDRMSNTYQEGKAPLFHTVLQLKFHFQSDPVSWAKSTDLGSIKRALAFSVEMNVSAPSSYGLRVEETRRGFEIKPSFSLGSLWGALRWMLWLDEWNRMPPLSCSECLRIFRPSTAHKMKYCTHECAHRATNREWRRKDLRQRKKILKARLDGGTYGPRKAR